MAQQTNPLADYFLEERLSKFKRVDNTKPHFNGVLPTYYNDCLGIIKKHTDIIKETKNPKTIYARVLQSRTNKPLRDTIKRWRQHPHSNLTDSFKNIYHPNITNKQKQITFRLLHSMTPTSQGYARKTGRQQNCTTCKKNTQETEEHIFYTCTHLKYALQTLQKVLALKTDNPPNIHQAIFLNVVEPQTDKTTSHIKLLMISMYRYSIWAVRLQTKKHNGTYTPKQIALIFIDNFHRLLKKHELEDAFWRLAGGADS